MAVGRVTTTLAPNRPPRTAPTEKAGNRSCLICLNIRIVRPTLVPRRTAPCSGIRIVGGNTVVMKASSITPPPRPAPTPMAPERQLRIDKIKNVVGVISGTELKNSITMRSFRTFTWATQCQSNNRAERHRYTASYENRHVAAG